MRSMATGEGRRRPAILPVLALAGIALFCVRPADLRIEIDPDGVSVAMSVAFLDMVFVSGQSRPETNSLGRGLR